MSTVEEQQFYRTLYVISCSLERIADALGKIAGSKSEPAYVKKEVAIPRDEEPTEHEVREIDFTGLSARVLNVFEVYNIKTPEQAAQFSRAAFLRVNALGEKSVKEIEAMLKKHGLCFGEKLRVQRQVEQ